MPIKDRQIKRVERIAERNPERAERVLNRMVDRDINRETKRKSKEFKRGEMSSLNQEMMRDYPLSATPEPKVYVSPTSGNVSVGGTPISSLKNRVKK